MTNQYHTFFNNATESLNRRQNYYITDESNEIENQVNKAIFEYKSHPTIILIKHKITLPELFVFTEASVSHIEK